MSLECGSGHAIQVRTLLPNSVLPAPAPLTTVLSTKGPRRQRPADYWPARSTMWTSRQFSRSRLEPTHYNDLYFQTSESHLFSIFATMPFLHLAKAGFSISSQLCLSFILRKQGFPSSQLCLFFISRKQVFHLRNYAFSSFREDKFSIFATMSFLHFAKLCFQAKQP